MKSDIKWACDLAKTNQHESAALLHAIRRARERYGFKLSLANYHTLCARAARTGGSGRVHIRWKKKDVLVVYNRELGQIVTFLSIPAKRT